ncbi:YjaG family protein [Larsenimonas rhizosphaerae]|uniref:YjaG family protein n=1 Tax=Larsenimonas rhizosphaerae TaxID=2944682 RepID=UPI0020345D70|nr:DUF416 family protein [Larsenimonas rhizosphaerae]MCM2131421.1 YjaG family protein [Larsenimonas rhizosphaerae]
MRFPDSATRTRILALSADQALGVAAGMTERMLPNYVLYADVSGTGDAARIRVMIDLIWEQLGPSRATIDFERQAEKLVALEPDTDRDESFGARLALDVTMALASCFDGLQKAEPHQTALEALRLSAGGVARFIEYSEGESEDDSLDEHPLMVDETGFAEALIEAVEEIRFDREGLKRLRRLARNQGVSNIGLSLDDDTPA